MILKLYIFLTNMQLIVKILDHIKMRVQKMNGRKSKTEKGHKKKKVIFRPEMTEEELKDPISLEAFFEPVVTNCGHFFEKENLLTMIGKMKRGEICKCPTCRTEIYSWESDPKFDRRFERFLKKQPDFNDERFFNARSFFHDLPLLMEKKLKDESKLTTIKKINELLVSSKKYLNQVVEDVPGYEGLTPVTLLAGQPGAITYAIQNKLVDKIEPEGLNAIGTNGENKGLSAVFNFAANEKGRALLSSNAKLRAKIQPNALNAVRGDGNFRGATAVTMLVQHPDGIDLLNSDKKLCNKITTESLSAKIDLEIRNSNSHKFHGYSALTFLASSKKGIKFLRENPALCKKIDAKALHSVIPTWSTNAGMSVLTLLAKEKEGLVLILANPHLSKLLTNQELNYFIKEHWGDKSTFALWLNSGDGRFVEAANTEIITRLKIDEEFEKGKQEYKQAFLPSIFSSRKTIKVTEPKTQEEPVKPKFTTATVEKRSESTKVPKETVRTEPTKVLTKPSRLFSTPIGGKAGTTASNIHRRRI